MREIVFVFGGAVLGGLFGWGGAALLGATTAISVMLLYGGALGGMTTGTWASQKFPLPQRRGRITFDA